MEQKTHYQRCPPHPGAHYHGQNFTQRSFTVKKIARLLFVLVMLAALAPIPAANADGLPGCSAAACK
jgi:hypothetical protein